MPLCSLEGSFVVSFHFEWSVCGEKLVNTRQFNGSEHGYSSGPGRYHGQHCKSTVLLILYANVLTNPRLHRP
jgi:hypothetical protein